MATTCPLNITVLSEYEAEAKLAGKHKHTHLISIRSPDDEEIAGFSKFNETHRLILRFDDVVTPRPGRTLPTAEHVKDIIRFAEVALKEGNPVDLLAHCHGGISRSSAAAYIFGSVIFGAGFEPVALGLVYLNRSIAQPNELMISIADTLMRPDFKMKETHERIKARRAASV